MRYLFSLLLVYLGLSLCMYSPASGQSLGTMEEFDTPVGTRLYYAVIAKGKAYGFFAKVLTFKWNKEVGVQWKTNEWGGNKEGEITLTKQATQYSGEIITTFEPNIRLIYSEQTAFWVSKKIYNALTQSWGAEIKTGEIKDFFSCVERDRFALSLDNQPVYVPCLKAKTQNGGSIWILDNRDAPLILKLDMGFEMELMTVLTREEE
ncbi:MAG: hypothetical protein K1X92_09435 [Bacteroidia bacterium]|nr:hypothetical protein [Bacteroidia bacterium]